MRWSIAIEGRFLTQPVRADAGVVFGTEAGWVTCVSPLDGRTIWSQRLKGSVSAIGARGQCVVAGTNVGGMACFDSSDGTRLAEQRREPRPLPGTRIVVASSVGTIALTEGAALIGTLGELIRVSLPGLEIEGIARGGSGRRVLVDGDLLAEIGTLHSEEPIRRRANPVQRGGSCGGESWPRWPYASSTLAR